MNVANYEKRNCNGDESHGSSEDGTPVLDLSSSAFAFEELMIRDQQILGAFTMDVESIEPQFASYFMLLSNPALLAEGRIDAFRGTHILTVSVKITERIADILHAPPRIVVVAQGITVTTYSVP